MKQNSKITEFERCISGGLGDVSVGKGPCCVSMRRVFGPSVAMLCMTTQDYNQTLVEQRQGDCWGSLAACVAPSM